MPWKTFLPTLRRPQQKYNYWLHMWFLRWQKQKKSRSPLTLKIHPSSSSDFSFPRKISLSVPFPSLSHLSLGSHPGARQTPSQSAELPMGHKGFHCRAIGPRHPLTAHSLLTGHALTVPPCTLFIYHPFFLQSFMDCCCSLRVPCDEKSHAAMRTDTSTAGCSSNTTQFFPVAT